MSYANIIKGLYKKTSSVIGINKNKSKLELLNQSSSKAIYYFPNNLHYFV